EVNVQDNVKSNGSVSSGNVNISGTTVQREVNVQDNVKTNGSVSSGNVSVSGTTVQREVNVQDNVKEVRKSGLRQRGSTRNRTDRLRRN
ncbi:hypothetical protein, partial [Bacillus cytotoxicus]